MDTDTPYGLRENSDSVGIFRFRYPMALSLRLSTVG